MSVIEDVLEPSLPLNICGICGEKKQKVVGVTRKKRLVVYLCTTIAEGERMPCDGYAYKISVLQ